MIPLSLEQQQFVRKDRQRYYFVKISRVLLLVLFIGLWEFTTRIDLIDSFIFSSPCKIMTCFLSMVKDHSIFPHIAITLFEVLVSFILVIVCSLLFAIILWYFPIISDVLEPTVIVLNSLPKSALAPLLIVWLGANQRTIIVAGMSVAIFGSIISLHTSFQSTDKEKIKLIYTLHGSKIQALTKVVIPSSLPSLVSIMKVNIGLCLVGVVIGEFLAARSGLGYLIIYSSQVFKMDWLLMSIVLLCIMAILLYALIDKIEKRIKKHP
ncbi:MAG: ABC transporter permease [Eubacteriales bacterium]